jgi:hypothetical protein
MKNYVVWTNCDVVGEDPIIQARLNIAPCDNTEARAAYDTMNRISRLTAKKFLQGDWEPVVWTDPAPSRLDIFKRNWGRIRDLWHQEPCNILYLDSDTMFLRSTKIFDRFAEFRVFNWTDPKSTSLFANYYNAGVRYYPASMSSELWQVGNSMAAIWQDDNWGMEQDIFNTMFWQQQIPDHDRHHPELNWQGMNLIRGIDGMQSALEAWNLLPVSKAHIIHVHGSRNAMHTAQLMTDIAKQLGIEV